MCMEIEIVPQEMYIVVLEEVQVLVEVIPLTEVAYILQGDILRIEGLQTHIIEIILATEVFHPEQEVQIAILHLEEAQEIIPIIVTEDLLAEQEAIRLLEEVHLLGITHQVAEVDLLLELVRRQEVQGGNNLNQL